MDGPRADEYHRRELPGHKWVSCRFCPALRVHDWHYFYCRRLGNQSKPDEWNAGWFRLGHSTYEDASKVPCGLPEVTTPLQEAEKA